MALSPQDVVFCPACAQGHVLLIGLVEYLPTNLVKSYIKIFHNYKRRMEGSISMETVPTELNVDAVSGVCLYFKCQDCGRVFVRYILNFEDGTLDISQRAEDVFADYDEVEEVEEDEDEHFLDFNFPPLEEDDLQDDDDNEEDEED